jgi:hypothetical protein
MSWKTVLGVRAGSSHLASGTPCQDYVAAALLPNGAVVGAISDGMGSVSKADIGSTVSVLRALECLVPLCSGHHHPTHPQVRAVCDNVLSEVRKTLYRTSLRDGTPVDQYSCTLTAFAATPYWIGAMGIGDCFLTAKFADGFSHELLLAPDKGEYENFTFSVVGDSAFSHLRWVLVRRRPRCIIASTDGLLDVALHPETREPHQPLFDYLEQEIVAPDADRVDEFLQLPDVETGDDRSILCCLWRDEPAIILTPRSLPQLSVARELLLDRVA